MNVFKTAFLLGLLTLLLVWVGEAVGGRSGMLTAFVFACVMNLSAYWFSDKLVLSLYRAQPISETEAPEIYRMVGDLSGRAGIPIPRIYRIPSQTPNAFATGRSPQHAVVAVTDGILEILSEDELKGVLAHELAHVVHRDILISTVAATLAGAISMLASMARWAVMFRGGRSTGRDERSGGHPIVLLVASIVAPLAAMLVQLAVSRSREFHADEKGAGLCGDPLVLASALRKLEAGVSRFPMQTAHPETAHLFIVNPLRGDGLAKLFSTHPPLEERIARLEKLAQDA